MKSSLPSFEEVSEYLSYCPDTGCLRWKVDKARAKSGDVVSGVGRYYQVQINGKRIYAHRVAWLLHYGEWPADEIDHINGDCKDNRICNLRNVTHRENQRNMKIGKNNTTGVQGVIRIKDRNQWRAILADRFLGQFDYFLQACAARWDEESLTGFVTRIES